MTDLIDEIELAARSVRTDAYSMSISELVSQYEDGDLVIDPEFQRLFRWEPGQKSKLIESLLLGIPLPSIFVFETDQGKWELIDGLQRLSTILEFMGKLRLPEGVIAPPSVLEATRYLPSLHNVVWEESDQVEGVAVADQRPLDKTQQLAIRRARLGVEILKRPSDDATKFDLFQRLNAGGTVANAQELRNSITLMVNAPYFRALRTAAENDNFKTVTGINEDQEQKQRHLELAMRFLVHTFIEYDGKLDVEEYIDEGAIALARNGDIARDTSTIIQTFDLLSQADGDRALRRFDGVRHTGKIGLVALETIAVGIAKNLSDVRALPDAVGFIRQKSRDFWQDPATANFTSPGVRGTTRIQRTVPYGAQWFQP
ncbi:hypothetical protein BV98_002984 [Sphingobium herbicidovorans NBRC 16415]|uniref:GmrSD restriction endonucleases N-terminal domain-containing protein n=1 Tax=Sphingobium herbicidovorans (strain ATCC 700291 / DSM 11019 / CCUG 56400 / KCTC 2939 / LMG 18315 / NBRC 16415 / MH) TaxID=1219045 RepID=A0A086P6Y9_SPHHM|nr:DUF262 domain-containing protein [Sphingobium herbicidovorans]KFG89157.1 hypothetical protein BV98_002984 [Sphingobium herbicidovorans NBRC 16415]